MMFVRLHQVYSCVIYVDLCEYVSMFICVLCVYGFVCVCARVCACGVCVCAPMSREQMPQKDFQCLLYIYLLLNMAES